MSNVRRGRQANWRGGVNRRGGGHKGWYVLALILYTISYTIDYILSITKPEKILNPQFFISKFLLSETLLGTPVANKKIWKEF